MKKATAKAKTTTSSGGTKTKAPGRKMGKWKKPSEELVELFYKVASTNPRADQRKMFGCPVAFLNGNMFFSVHQDELIVRLPEKQREKLINDGEGRPFCPMPGMTMKEYVSLGDEIVADTKAVTQLFKQAFAYVEGLPPKKKKAKKKEKRAS